MNGYEEPAMPRTDSYAETAGACSATPLPWAGVRGTAAPFSEAELSILTEAQGLVHGPRQEAYGHPANDFSRTAALASILLAGKLKEDLGPEDVALFMVCVKLSREVNAHKRDNLVDAAGYLETLNMVHAYMASVRSKDAP